MTERSLAAAMADAGGPLPLLRGLGLARFSELPDAYTHWISEQRAWHESCAFADQSFHMTELTLSGPGGRSLLSALAVNDVHDLEPGETRHLVCCSPGGYVIGDSVVFALADERLLSVGTAPAHDWIRYHAETGEEEVSAAYQRRPVATGEPPERFRFQLRGPRADDVLAASVDGPLPDVAPYTFEAVTIDGTPATLLYHRMAKEDGYELWGPYGDGEAVRETILDRGEAHGIRRLGTKSYLSHSVVSGWIPLPLPAIYDGGGDLAEYRRWLDWRAGLYSIGGSFDGDDVTDYYLTPAELGYGHLVDHDHAFVGREALAAASDRPDRRKVTLTWDGRDVVSLFGSLFEPGATEKFVELPHPRSSACHYDAVLADGEPVGVSKWMAYVAYERELVSLAVVDADHAAPGTELTVVWGEADGDAARTVESHELTEVRARVRERPLREG